jgi:hypothetical protein
MKPSPFPKLVAVAALAAVAGGTQAALVTYGSLVGFTAATTGLGVDTFNDLSIASTPSPLNRSAGTFAYRASAVGAGSQTFFPAGTPADIWLSTDSAFDSIVFDNFGSAPTAIGAFFFGSNQAGAFLPGVSIQIVVTDSGGSVSRVFANTATTSFVGFTSNLALVSLTVSAIQPSSTTIAWPTVNDLHLATAVPEPAPLVVFSLAGLAGLVAYRRRRG